MTIRLLFTIVIAALLLVGCSADDANPSPEQAHNHDTPVQPIAVQEAAPDADQKWTCSMHPHIVEDEPGVCPVCGMDLVPMKQSGASDEGTIEINPVTIQNMGVRTALVEVAPLQRRVRTTGRFAVNEQAQVAVAPKIGGWVERLHVEYEGARVQKGQPLMEVYSPELVATQEEYLLALRNAERLDGSAGEADAQRLLRAAERRLSYWDITAAQIEQLKTSGTPRKTMTLYAPASGTVTMKHVTEGQEIRPGQTLLEITDLGRLWLMVDVYEQDLAWIASGSTVEINLPYQPGSALTGTVDYIYDTMDADTRTVRARVVVPNPERRLKPGMYATATLVGTPTEARPTIPLDAVVSTGEREVVIVALGAGRFRPVEVRTGLESGSRVQVMDGLAGSERVVTSAQFLIDSEARLQSAVGAMASGHNHGSMEGGASAEQPAMKAPAMDHSTHDHQTMDDGTPMEKEAESGGHNHR